MQTINSEKLHALMSQTQTWVINVLSHNNFVEEHIPNSINIPVTDQNFEEQVDKAVKDKYHPVVVYCASEDCDASAKAAQRLEAHGYNRVIDFEGGMKEWKETGKDIEKG